MFAHLSGHIIECHTVVLVLVLVCSAWMCLCVGLVSEVGGEMLRNVDEKLNEATSDFITITTTTATATTTTAAMTTILLMMSKFVLC